MDDECLLLIAEEAATLQLRRVRSRAGRSERKGPMDSKFCSDLFKPEVTLIVRTLPTHNPLSPLLGVSKFVALWVLQSGLAPASALQTQDPRFVFATTLKLSVTTQV